MKICLVAKEYPPETAHGGIGSQTWNKAGELVARGHEVDVVSGSAERSTTVRVQVDETGAVVHRIPPIDADGPVYGEASFDLGYTWLVARYLQRLQAERNFDLLDFPEYGGEGFAFQLGRSPWTWVPVVVQLHGPLAMFTERIGWPPDDGDLYRVGTFLEEYSITHADGLMACSANIADFTAASCAIPREEIAVVHCGVDAATFTPAEAGETASDRPTVLFVGNLEANKGLLTVLNAVVALRDRHPDIRLEILGRGERDDLDEFVRRHEAQEIIHCAGFVSDRNRMPDVYRAANVFCSPAQHEVGVANVYIEAMACGCPVVAARTGGAPEAVEHGKQGLLVPPGHVEATAAALDRVLSDPGLQDELGRAGRRRVEGYFAMGPYIERVLAVYEEAIERSLRRLEESRVEAGLVP